jgi:23S rRNA pseudouridine2457 synthase
VLVAFNKPYGVVSQFTPLDGHPSLAGFGLPKGIYACGRLDHDSEGLLLLSDDGDFIHRYSDPKFKVEKTYWAQVERLPDEAALARLRKGLTLKDGPTKPCKARLIAEPSLPPREPPIRFRKNVPTAWQELSITEGRNRQVRRMTAAAGYPTLRLVRVRIGDVSLSGLAPGRWRALPS